MTPAPAHVVDSIQLAARAGPSIVALGGAFMLDDATTERGAALGLDLASFYGLGRGAVLGDADADVIAAAFPFISIEVVRAVIPAARAALPPAQAIGHYAEACRAWGRTHLGAVSDLDRLADLLKRVVSAASVAGNPLLAGWRAVALPDDAEGRAAQLLFLAREHRGGPHLAALLAGELSPLDAIIVSEGPESAALYGWPEPYPDPEPLRERHAAAVALTDRLVAPAYATLNPAEGDDLLDILGRALHASGLADTSA